MKTGFKRYFSIFVMLFVLLGSIPFPTVKAESSALQDGEYTIDFMVLKDGKDERSEMEKYVEKPARLTVKDGKQLIAMTLKNSDWIQFLKVDSNGVGKENTDGFVEVTELSKNTEENTRLVQFQVDVLSSKLDAYMHIFVSGMGYDNKYIVQFQFDESSIQPINTGTPELPVTSEIYFSALHKSDNKLSSMDNYFLKPAKLTVSGTEAKVQFTIKNSSVVTSLKVGTDLVEATNLSTDAAANTRVVEFAIGSVEELVPARVHISTTTSNGPYEMDHDIRLNFKAANFALLSETISVAEEKLKGATVGTEPGQYPAEAKATLEEAILAASSVKLDVFAQQAQADEAVQALEAAVAAFEAAVVVAAPEIPGEENVYPLNYMIYKEKTDSQSVMYNYVVPESGQLTVRDDKMYVSFALKQSKEITSFKVKQHGELKETEIVAQDESANTRTIQFEVEDLSERVAGWVKIYWQLAEGVYDNEYNVELGFELKNAPVTDKNELLAAIREAQATHDEATEGTEAGQYPGGAKAALQAAIEKAEKVNSNAKALQLEVDRAVAALKAAVTAFEAAVNQLEPVKYQFDFVVMQENEDTVSLMDSYFSNRYLTIVDGKYMVNFTVNNSSQVAAIKVNHAGDIYTDVEVVSEDQAHDTRLVRFAVASLDEVLKGKVDIQVGAYKAAHIIRFVFNKDSIKLTDLSRVDKGSYVVELKGSNEEDTTALAAVLEEMPQLVVQEDSKKLLSFAVKDGVTIDKLELADGQGGYTVIDPVDTSASAKALVTVLAATAAVKYELTDLTASYRLTVTQGGQAQTIAFNLDSAKPVLTEEEPETENPGTETPGTGNPGTSNPGTGTGSNPGTGTGTDTGTKDGKYNIQFNVLKYNTTSVSVMDGYVEHPATLRVDNGRNYVSITLKNSQYITAFKVERNGSLITPSTTETDREKDTRTVEFEVSDLTKPLNAWVKVYWPNFDGNNGLYDHEYDVHLKFGSISAYSASAGSGGSSSTAYKSGEYTVDYAVLKKGTTTKSDVDSQLVHPGTITYAYGKIYFAAELINQAISELKVERAAETVRAKIVEKDGRRYVEFQIDEVSKPINGRLQITLGDKSYSYHDVTFTFNEHSMRRLGASTASEAGDEDGQTDTKEGSAISAKQMKDIEGHWAKSAIEKALAQGFVTGYKDGTFRPNGSVTRGEFTAMIARALQLEGKAAELAFQDAAQIPAWAKAYVAEAVGAGIIGGYADQTFRPDSQITRSEMAAMIVRASGLPLEAAAALSFEDKAQIPQWAQAQVATAVQAGLMSGKTTTKFVPNAKATRAEAVAVILTLTNVRSASQSQPASETPSSSQPQTATESGAAVNSKGIANGEYSLDYTVWKDQTENKSVMDDYTLKPATVKVDGDQYTVTLTLKNAGWIKSLKVDPGNVNYDASKFVEVKTISEDKEKDTRVVQFEVSGLTDKLYAYTHVIVTGIPGLDYDNEYIVQFHFDEASLKAI